MSNFNLKKLSGEPVMLLTLHGTYSVKHDLPESNPQVFDMLDSMTEPVFYVLNPTQARFSVEDMIQAARITIKSDKSTFNHPNVRGMIFVTKNKAVKLGLKGLNSASFGYINVMVFSTVEEALEYCRAHKN